MITENEIAEFDAYIKGELTDLDRAIFDDKLKSDKNFQRKFYDYKNDFNTISKAAELADFREQLKGIHNTIYPKKKIFLLQSKVLSLVGIAAVLILGFFVMQNFISGNGSSADEGYNELAYTAVEESAEAEMDDQVASVMDSMSDENTFELEENAFYDTSYVSFTFPSADKQPKGTAFIIDLNGYFLTSKHLTKGRNYLTLQQRDNDLAFKAKVIYEDSLLDFALVKAQPEVLEHLTKVPYRFCDDDPSLGEEVFTLGYTKKEIVYTKGDVSALSGYKGNKNYVQVSMPANSGNSGAPLFTISGEFYGIITANNSKKQSVTYVMNHRILHQKLIEIQSNALNFGLMAKKMKRYKLRKEMIKDFTPYIFEVH